MKAAEEIIEKLNLSEHPEGGYFRQTYKSELLVQPLKSSYERVAATHIYYFLPEGTYSKFHKVKHDEIWTLYAGGGVKLYLFDANENKVSERILSARDLKYHTVIQGSVWQAAEPIGDYALLGCIVAPGWEMEDTVNLCDDHDTLKRLIKLMPDYNRLI